MPFYLFTALFPLFVGNQLPPAEKPCVTPVIGYIFASSNSNTNTK
ncbi:MAG: hypothetical protein NTW10_00285 [Bacteroidetes bacterium]|nr:hypothetical protein [Bacteroidota bacterium]